MGFFSSSNDKHRPTTNEKGRSIATPASKIKAERKAREARAADVQARKIAKGKHW